MARIRNIKPDYFRHEALQDLEAAHPGQYIMLTYIALWCQCDANGIFPWRPRTLKLDILPFIPYDLTATLQILHHNNYITQYTTPDGNQYGHIPTFKTHQRITGKEATEGEKYPKPNQSKPGNTRETPGKHPDAQGEERITGKEIREREGHNAHAREGQPENQKNTPTTETQKNETTTPPQPSTRGGEPTPTDPYTHCIRAINNWAKPDNWQPLRDYAHSVGYQPDQHGPVADEVKKFTAYHLDPRRRDDDRAAFLADPAQFFQDKGRKWLLDAKNMNKQPKNTAKKTQYEPPPQHHRSHPRTNGNAHPTTTHIADLIGKTITEISA